MAIEKSLNPSSAPRSPTQRDRAYTSLKHILTLQQIPPGQRLREPYWAARLNVNRAALRETLARLEAEGWLTRGPRTGYFTPQLTPDDISDIMAIRAMLECLAIDHITAAGRTGRDELEPLIEACDELESFIRSDYLLGCTEADRKFHERLVRLSGSRQIAMVYDRSPLPMIYAPLIGTDRWEREMRDTVEQHRQIIKHIEHGDASKAKSALRRHLDGQYLQELNRPVRNSS